MTSPNIFLGRSVSVVLFAVLSLFIQSDLFLHKSLSIEILMISIGFGLLSMGL